MNIKNITNYNHKLTESKWQKIWDQEKLFKFDENSEKQKYYVLEMFPYPSGRIHMGHLRNYTIGDVVARYRRMQGFNVLHPMGFDSFGLPAENAALQNKIHPQKWTLENIATMRQELKSIGLAIDWEREVITCLPEYYRHEQKIFIDFVKNGLAYQKESLVNWDPVDNTVLANEQVIDGRGWRSGAIIEKRKLKQWFLKVSDFSQELLDELKNLKGWDERVLTMQEKWIGRSEGLEIDFTLSNHQNLSLNIDKVNIYTTRPDTLFGASFVAIAPNHPISINIAKNNPSVAEFIKKCNSGAVDEQTIEKQEKIGLDTKLLAINPINQEKIPVYIANFVLMDYGTGAIFGCPAHDQRDFEFATKYQLAIKSVVANINDYLGFSDIIDYKNPAIIDLANDIKKKAEDYNKKLSFKDIATEKNSLEISIINISLEFIRNNIIASHNAEDLTVKSSLKASEVLINKRAFCFGRATLLAAILRYLDIPCGFCDQLLLLDDNSDKKIIHTMNVVYLKNSHKILKIDATNNKDIKQLPFDGINDNIAYIADEKLGEVNQISIYGDPHQQIIDLYENSKNDGEITANLFSYNENSYRPQQIFAENGIIINSQFLDGLNNINAKEKVAEILTNLGVATKKINYRLRDWGVSRQRYWGCPIPMLYLEDGSVVAVPEEELPVTLPEDVEFTGNGNPLANHPTWKYTTYQGKRAIRETDSFDTFFESSWYFLRYISSPDNIAFDSEVVNKFMPVDDYIGGVEHAVLHLLYARFFVKALRKCGYLNFSEPFKNLLTQGMVCHQTFKDSDGNWLYPSQIVEIDKDKFIDQETKKEVIIGRSEKMSKSKKNVIEPAPIIASYGADTARLFMLSDSPPERDLEWSEAAIDGSWRYINRLWKIISSLDFGNKEIWHQESSNNHHIDNSDFNQLCNKQQEFYRLIHQTIAGVQEEYNNNGFNRAIAKIREFSNALEKFINNNFDLQKTTIINQKIIYFACETLILLISPITPHLAEELWQEMALGKKSKMVSIAEFPKFDKIMLINDKFSITIQVNGKLRGVIEVSDNISQEEVINLAKNNENVRKFLTNCQIVKTIFIPKKLINFVIK